MTQLECTYSDRDAVLVAYLYEDIDAAERIAFETHVMSCLPCRSELADLRHVRTTLGRWAPPDTTRAFSFEPRAASPAPRAWWYTVPVWAQVAAAMLVLGVSASIANLDVQYDKNGLNVRTGWSKPAAVTEQAAQTDAAPWRAELAALQSQLQSEIRTQAKPVAALSPAPQVAMSDTEFSRRVRVMLDENQKKQDQDLALHLVQLQRDFEAQRQADLRRTNQLFRQVTSTYGDEIAKHERQINYLLPNSQR